MRTKCLPLIYAGIDCIRILCRHLPKRIFDYNRRVHSHTEFQKQNTGIAAAVNKILTPPCRRIPDFVLHKGIITSQIHCHRSATDRAFRYQFRRNFHICLMIYHCSNRFFIIISIIMARFCALPQALIALRVKQAAFVKARTLKLMVNIGCQHKIVLIFYEFK